MPEPESHAAILRRRLDDRERNALLLGREGAANVMQNLDGVKSIEAAEQLLADVRSKAERVVCEVREQEARAGRSARDQSDVSAERHGTIHEEAAGADGSPAGDPPPPPAPAADSSFEVEKPAPVPAMPPPIPSSIIGDLVVEPTSRELWFEYMDLLFARAKKPDCPEHVFDRIEQGVSTGPPA